MNGHDFTNKILLKSSPLLPVSKSDTAKKHRAKAQWHRNRGANLVKAGYFPLANLHYVAAQRHDEAGEAHEDNSSNDNEPVSASSVANNASVDASIAEASAGASSLGSA